MKKEAQQKVLNKGIGRIKRRTMNGLQEEEMQSFSVSFDYTGFDAFQDVAQALQSFSDAYESYRKSKTARLRVVRFTEGSLDCHLEANAEAWTTMTVMAQDLSELQQGRVSVLMPDRARDEFRQALAHVTAIRINLNGSAYSLDKKVSNLLESRPKKEASRTTVHSGILDRVDLKANTFRIMLPHGQRLNCSPCLLYVPQLSSALRTSVPRVRVTGRGRYRSDLLPSTIAVERVEVIEFTRTFRDVLARVTNSIDKEKVTAALEAQYKTLESQFEDFTSAED